LLKFANTGCDEILELDHKKVQSIIIGWLVDMKDNQKQAPNSMKAKLSAVKMFFNLNDYVDINWSKVKRYIGEFYRVAEDRPYTRKEIKRLVDATHTLRDKAIILLLASSGMRRGAIINLRLKHLQKLEVYNNNDSIFLIDVYKQAKEHYFTFCTPEARKAIEDYQDWRVKLGEKLTPDSPLFREQFDIRFGARGKVIPITETAITHMLNTLRNETGIVEHQPLTESVKNGSHRSKIFTAHGFRKFFDTTCTSNGMDTLYVETIMGHNTGLKHVYFKPQVNEVLEGNDRMRGYISVINDLTISEENRLRSQVERLTIDTEKIDQQAQEIAQLKVQLQGYKDDQARAQDTSMASIRELRRRLDATEDKHEKALLALEHTRKTLIHYDEKHKQEKFVS
jgi:integrase